MWSFYSCFLPLFLPLFCYHQLVVDSFQGQWKLGRRVTLHCEDIVLFTILILWEHACLSSSKLNKLNKQELLVYNSFTTYGLHISKTSSLPMFFIIVSQKHLCLMIKQRKCILFEGEDIFIKQCYLYVIENRWICST